MDSCAGILCKEEESLGLMLVNNGFDLWLPNSRGNIYSKDHQNFDEGPKKGKELDNYWDYSFQHMATYDQPALWKYIEKVTGKSEFVYIGHSQGTTQMFAALAEQPDFFRTRMKLFIAIAPVVYIDNIFSKVIKEMITNSAIIKGFEIMGPEIAPYATRSNPIKAAIMKGFLGKYL